MTAGSATVRLMMDYLETVLAFAGWFRIALTGNEAIVDRALSGFEWALKEKVAT